jgi:hypothetical protein
VLISRRSEMIHCLLAAFKLEARLMAWSWMVGRGLGGLSSALILCEHDMLEEGSVSACHGSSVGGRL